MKKLAMIMVALAGVSAVCVAAEDGGPEKSLPPLLPFVGSNGKMGYVDAKGAVVIPPAFDGGEPFVHDLCPVIVDKKGALIDRAGKVVVRTQYRAVNCARPCCQSTPEFLEDFTRKAVTEPRTVYVSLKVEARQMKFGLLGPTGEELVSPMYEPTRRGESLLFVEGMASVKRGNSYAYLDEKGAIAIPGPFAHAYVFKDGVGYVQNSRGQWSAIDRKGHTLRGPGTWSDVVVPAPLGEGLYAHHSGGKWGCKDASGKIVIPATKFTIMWPFTEGLAMVQWDGSANGKQWGLMNSSGKVIGVIERDHVMSRRPFSHGLMVIRLQEVKPGTLSTRTQTRYVSHGCVYVDSEAKTVIHLPEAQDAFSFFKEQEYPFAVVALRKGMGIIDKSGRWVLDPKHAMRPFIGDVAVAMKIPAGKQGPPTQQLLINKAGKTIAVLPTPPRRPLRRR